MTAGFPRLLGDIGGTNARWAWQAEPAGALLHYASYPCSAYPTLHAVVEQFLRDHALPRPKRVAFGIATPISGDEVRMTNHAWQFSIATLQATLGVERCLVLNDFAALATALPALGPADCRGLGGPPADPLRPLAVLGPGTGLGVAGLLPVDAGARHLTIAGEGGHVTLAASDAREAAVLEVMRRRFGHVSAERALSGPGLVNLYEALCKVDARAARALQPADVTRLGLAGDDATCGEALRLFAAFLGSVAGNLALTLGARGGVFIGGGIVPRLGPAFDASTFRQRFVEKGRFQPYLEQIATLVITTPAPGLLGAARALDALDD